MHRPFEWGAAIVVVAGELFLGGDGKRLDRPATYIVAAFIAGAARAT